MLVQQVRGLVTVALLGGCVLAEPQASALPALAEELPVREVTVFKDGHAFVLREASRPADAAGRIVLDELPEPVLGTFWPYAFGGPRLLSATAARERVEAEHSALDLVELVRANAGREVVLVETDGTKNEGRLLGLTRRDAEEVEANDPEGARPRLPELGKLVLLATSSATRAVPVEHVRELEVRGELVRRFSEQVLRERLTLRVDQAGGDVTVGVAYVQKGLRWIPAYRIELGADERAAVRLEATLVNDLVDLEHATVHLVVGAPRFEFAGEIDPISLREVAAGIRARVLARDRFSNLASNPNVLMTQAAGFVEAEQAPAGPELGPGTAEEDLFLYSLRDVTLRKGERMVLPLSEFTLPYRDVYVLEVPLGPPPELSQQWTGERALEIARLLAAPKAMHTLRLENTSDAPFTTAPALVLSGGKPLAQGRMLYTPRGARTDLGINPAVDVRVEIEEHEQGRTTERMAGDDYQRTAVCGSITLTNLKSKAVELEVRRDVLGLVDEVGQGGQKVQRGLSESWSAQALPPWWGWYSWPYWWFRFNGLGRFSWSTKLEPGASAKLEASWHYFWR